jgi:hypothetical protein
MPPAVSWTVSDETISSKSSILGGVTRGDINLGGTPGSPAVQGSPVAHSSSSNAGGSGARFEVENCIGAPAVARRRESRVSPVVAMSVRSVVGVASVGWGVVLIRGRSERDGLVTMRAGRGRRISRVRVLRASSFTRTKLTNYNKDSVRRGVTVTRSGVVGSPSTRAEGPATSHNLRHVFTRHSSTFDCLPEKLCLDGSRIYREVTGTTGRSSRDDHR